MADPCTVRYNDGTTGFRKPRHLRGETGMGVLGFEPPTARVTRDIPRNHATSHDTRDPACTRVRYHDGATTTATRHRR